MKHGKLRLVLFVIAVSASARAQATRTYISGTGDDANPCSRSSPCKTFANALTKTTAGGEIDATDPGSYGPVTIDKAITLDGSAALGASIVLSTGTGITVSAGTSDVVTLRNISVQGVGLGATGVKLNQAKSLHLEGCVFTNLTGNGIDLEPTNAANVSIDNTASRDNGGEGLYLQGSIASVTVAVSNSRFENNTMDGIFAGGNSRVTVRTSDSSSNSANGFLSQASSGTASMSIVNSIASFNIMAAFHAGGGTAASTLRITGSSAFSNGSAVFVDTNGYAYSYGNNYLTGGGTLTGTIAPQ